MDIFINLKNVDWELLRNQKTTLINSIDMAESDGYTTLDLDGILHLLDNIQDQAADILGQGVIFGVLPDE